MKQDETLRVSEGKLLWEPADYLGGDPNIISYLRWLNSNRGLEFSGYEDLWAKLWWYSSDDEIRNKYIEQGRKIVLSKHSFANRADAIMKFLKEFI